MHGMLSEHFLRRFAGSLIRRRNLPTTQTVDISGEPAGKHITGSDGQECDENYLKETVYSEEVNGRDNIDKRA